MIIKWIGHSCFSIFDGIKILTDPFIEQIKYPFTEEEYDIVTESHQHSDHNAHKRVAGNFKLLGKSGNTRIKNVEIRGFDTYHDKVEGKERGKNILFRFQFDSGISLLHMGDIGHILGKETVEKIGRINILMLPVGGIYTVDSINAAEIVKELNPDIILPMHYKTKYVDFEIATEESFISLMNMPVEYVNSLKVDISNISDYCGKIILFNI